MLRRMRLFLLGLLMSALAGPSLFLLIGNESLQFKRLRVVDVLCLRW